MSPCIVCFCRPFRLCSILRVSVFGGPKMLVAEPMGGRRQCRKQNKSLCKLCVAFRQIIGSQQQIQRPSACAYAKHRPGFRTCHALREVLSEILRPSACPFSFTRFSGWAGLLRGVLTAALSDIPAFDCCLILDCTSSGSSC